MPGYENDIGKGLSINRPCKGLTDLDCFFTREAHTMNPDIVCNIGCLSS